PRGSSAADERDEVAPFHCPMPPVLWSERIAHLIKTAALRDFNPAYDRCGSDPGLLTMSATRPLFHRKRKSIRDLAMSQKCQVETFTNRATTAWRGSSGHS